MPGELFSILTFQGGYNTSVVLAGVIALGIGGGVIGVFSFLRKRALIADAISHATLPGIAIAFLIGIALGGTGRNLALLMAGAATTGALGVLCVQWVRDYTRLPEDAAIGTVLSVFFSTPLSNIILVLHTSSGVVNEAAIAPDTLPHNANKIYLFGSDQTCIILG